MQPLNIENLSYQERFDLSVYLYHSADLKDIGQMLYANIIRPAMTESLRLIVKTTNRYDQGQAVYDTLKG